MSTTTIPFPVHTNIFDREIRGIFGRFQTKNSFCLNYVLASLPFDSIDMLTTAGKAIDIKDKKVTFSQIIQRDVNYERVAKMADEYLEQSAGKVVFFPPLLVSLIGFDNDGSAKERYQNAQPFFSSGEFIQRWDDFFEMRLPLTDADLGHKISVENIDKYFYNFGASLKFKSSKVKLVVIDGQHRLEALRAIQKRDVAKTIEIPVCIVFPPDAISGTEEDITVDLRELFLTVNQQQQKVSGHFLTLLDDQRLSAETIRLWGDDWKQPIDDYGFTPLQLLEWNQRHDRLENQVTRPFTITTISIVAGALKEHLFNDEQQSGEVISLLKLATIKNSLEVHPDAPMIDEITDTDYHSSQFSQLQIKIKENIVPSLDILFRQLTPYNEQELKVRSSFEYLNDKIISQVNGYETYKTNVLQNFRTLQAIDTNFVRDAGRDFELLTLRDEQGVKRFFFTNVFQQGLVRVWIDVAKLLSKFGVSTPLSATIVIVGLNAFFVKEAATILSYDKAYVRRTLFNGERLLVNARSKTAWRDIILLSLGTQKSLAAIRKSLSSIAELSEEEIAGILDSLKSVAYASGHGYLDRYKEIIKVDLSKNYFERDLDSLVIQKLTKLDRSGKPDDRIEFDKIIESESTNRMAKARTQLALALNLVESSLISNVH